MVGIINYGLGNLGSIQNMLKMIGEKSVISDDKDELERCDKLILPGVGAFDAGMGRLTDSGLAEFIKEMALAGGKPVLGICLGMQLLGRKSEEGTMAGLGLIPFDNVHFSFPAGSPLKIPHMGWDAVDFRQDSPLLSGIGGQQRYYFVHSYHARCDHEENVLMTCEYGYPFAAAVVKGNVYGVQFHPEKSHNFGMRLLENFVKRCQTNV